MLRLHCSSFTEKSQQNFHGLEAAKKVSYSIFQEKTCGHKASRKLQVIHGVQSKHRVNIYSPETQDKPNERPSSFCDTGAATESYLLASSCHGTTEIIQDKIQVCTCSLFPVHLFLKALSLTCKICEETPE